MVYSSTITMLSGESFWRTFILFTTLTVTCNALTCLQCRNEADPRMCSTVATCGQGEVCFVEEVLKIQTGQIVYHSGCKPQAQCHSVGGASWVGRRGIQEMTACIHCCSGDNCNAGGCGKTVTSTSTSTTSPTLPVTQPPTSPTTASTTPTTTPGWHPLAGNCASGSACDKCPVGEYGVVRTGNGDIKVCSPLCGNDFRYGYVANYTRRPFCDCEVARLVGGCWKGHQCDGYHDHSALVCKGVKIPLCWLVGDCWKGHECDGCHYHSVLIYNGVNIPLCCAYCEHSLLHFGNHMCECMHSMTFPPIYNP